MKYKNMGDLIEKFNKKLLSNFNMIFEEIDNQT
jgi:hypothetical protein